MNTSSRCTATAVIVLTALASDVQAFTCAAVRNSARFGESYRATNTPLLGASTSTRSLGSSVSRTARCGPLAMSEMAEDYPSDTGDDRFSTGGVAAEAERMSFTAEDSPEVTQLKLDLLRIAALTGRGQLATCAERNRVEDAIWELEMRTPIEDTAASEALLGRWALVYASEDATRSSPFFWAFRKATEALKAPFGLAEEGGIAATIFAVTDSLPGKSVGEAVQTITANEIKSEVEIFAGASAGSDRKGDGPPTFPSFRSVMTTTSEITDTSGTTTKMRVAKTQVRKSALGRLIRPLINLDDMEFKTDSLLSPLREGSTEVSMTTTYLDGLLRVSRNEQGQVFVFARADDAEIR